MFFIAITLFSPKIVGLYYPFPYLPPIFFVLSLSHFKFQDLTNLLQIILHYGYGSSRLLFLSDCLSNVTLPKRKLENN